jgi:hypothetical protein
MYRYRIFCQYLLSKSKTKIKKKIKRAGASPFSKKLAERPYIKLSLNFVFYGATAQIGPWPPLLRFRNLT